MTSSGRIKLRLWFYAIVLGYLICDFAIFRGPLYHMVSRALKPDPDVVAEVGSTRLTLAQIERAALEKLWLASKDPAALSPFERKNVRLAALNDLIDREILRELASARQEEIEATGEEIDTRLRALAARFETRDAMEKATRAQGIKDEKNLRYRAASAIRQEKFLLRETAARSAVTEDEAKQWFRENAEKLRIPARVEVRHVFLPTLDVPEEKAKARLEAALADLTAGKKDFATLAGEISLDPATSGTGGNLGWITGDRVIADFSGPVFLLPENQPSLVRSRLGWHLVEVTGRKPAEDRTWEEAGKEIIAALETVKRKQAVEEYRVSLRKQHESTIRVATEKITGAPFGEEVDRK